MKTWLRGVAPLLAVACFVALALARKKTESFERETPVPAGEPISVFDFVRPPLFEDIQLNPAGTHFSAIVCTEDDRRDLFAYHLATGKQKYLTGGGAFDIYDYEWVNDERLVFSLGRDKRYAAGLFAVELKRFYQAYPFQR